MRARSATRPRRRSWASARCTCSCAGRHDQGRNEMKRFIAAVALALCAAPALAQGYPSRPVVVVVPFAAGGPTDVIARTLAEPMRVVLGQPVVIENVTGANGNVGVGRVARAAPDGHTIGIGHWSTHVVNGAVYPLPYDLLRDFEPISLVSTNSYLIVAKNA